MTDDMTMGIGDLAALTGVPVRTIRFYCDEGILEPRRSGGGHRRFVAADADRLRLVRRLRALGLGLPAIVAVLTGDRSLGEAVATERRAVDAELSALAWRRASLRAVEDAGPGERAARVLDHFVGAHARGRAERDTPRFRRALLPAIAMEQDPRLRRYWDLYGEVTGEPVTSGAVNTWLIDSLESALAS